MIELRLAKVIMVASLALFAGLVTWNNLVDYGSNYAFVQHVLSMDTTFPDNRLMGRAITTPLLWQLGFGMIILGEGLTGLALLVGAVQLLRELRAEARYFDAAKRWVVIGATLGFLVWCLGFLIIGGEWFLMWQSQTWNGQQAAFRFYMTILAVLLIVIQPERELS